MLIIFCVVFIFWYYYWIAFIPSAIWFSVCISSQHCLQSIITEKMLTVPETFSMLMKSSFIVVSDESRKYNLFSELNRKKRARRGRERERDKQCERNWCRVPLPLLFWHIFPKYVLFGSLLSFSSATFYDRPHISCCVWALFTLSLLILSWTSKQNSGMTKSKLHF